MQDCDISIMYTDTDILQVNCWLGARLCNLHCFSNGDNTVLNQATNADVQQQCGRCCFAYMPNFIVTYLSNTCLYSLSLLAGFLQLCKSIYSDIKCFKNIGNSYEYTKKLSWYLKIFRTLLISMGPWPEIWSQQKLWSYTDHTLIKH